MSTKRVLISYFFGNEMIPLGVSCAEAFRALGWDVYRFNSQVESRWGRALIRPVNQVARALGYRKSYIGRSLPISKFQFKRRLFLEAVSAFRPHWVFVIRSHEFVDAEVVDLVKREHGVEKVIGWRVDGPLDSPGLLEDARIYDAYFCAHREGYDARSDRIHHLPVYGMDFALYRNLFVNAPRPYGHELVLVGGPNPRRERLVGEVLDLPLEIYGKWGKQARKSRAVWRRWKARGAWGEMLIRLYNTAKVILNITNWDPARHVALNQRVFDVPATGAFLLTDYSPELEQHFRIGQEIACFAGAEELRDKARWFLAHDAEREAIARRGYEKALTLPTVADRMRELIRHVHAA